MCDKVSTCSSTGEYCNSMFGCYSYRNNSDCFEVYDPCSHSFIGYRNVYQVNQIIYQEWHSTSECSDIEPGIHTSQCGECYENSFINTCFDESNFIAF
ncbi:hypothetical protein DFA_07344 [Cavenderia fasciculata]|uniref:Uncharacterized protein n=1 Tax=Cavenderia fasciculata TaxID=261658 RepID=F4PW59_CACFS|nr:uncharacterized protein DFA_07344 [Cavenderia fasciculata]EGG20223.1 hypothetical protein DFA_07344 [Cavenderia fasciculata]|eukprot:XP_004367206.1 hypothetical protein DFA_07344 [Cavenderia fasciculata]